MTPPSSFLLSIKKKEALFTRGLFFCLPIFTVTINKSLPLFLILLALSLTLTLGWKNTLSWRWNVPIVSLGLFLGWAGLSCVWSSQALASLGAFFRLLALMGMGLHVWQICVLLDEKVRTRLLVCALWGLIPALAWFIIESATQGQMWALLKEDTNEALVMYSAGSAALALFVWPLLSAFERFPKGRFVALACVCVVAFVLKLLYSHAAFYGFLLGVFVFGGTLWLGKRFFYAMMGASLMIMLGAPQLTSRFLAPESVEEMLPKQSAKLSYLHRAYIWSYVTHRIYEKPYAGWGFDAARHGALKQGLLWGSQKYGYNAAYNEALPGCDGEALPLHPHNAPLQIWLELGAVGALLWAAFLASLLWAVARAPLSRWALACASSSFAVAFFIGGTSYGAWQSWWIAALFLAAIFLRMGASPDRTAGSS
ncbi:MAG: hypothetical protein C0514_05495 [Candidatus Puniceispirillum sp.]|nr:hypothetical protein [Candidatus Puniceispirillum sp.]